MIIMKIKIILVILILGMVNMELLVRYQPTGEKWHEFQLEEGIKISKERNAAATANISLPNTFTTENASGYGKLQVLYNDYYLFDGISQSKEFGKDNIQLIAYDYLWNISKLRRMMGQGSTSVTPSQAFTDVFDNSGTSAYFTGIWGESYSAAWKTGYDATTYVVPADTATTYGAPFFDCINKSGTDFMKFLADISYRGDKYRYFYWFENIAGSWYLFFQPDGWGKTWKNLIYEVTSDLKETYEDIWNDIVVWGKQNSGFLPPTQDGWTESNLDGWVYVNIGAALNNFAFEDSSVAGFAAKKGSYMLNFDCDYNVGLDDVAWFERSLQERDTDYINLENLNKFHAWYRIDDVGSDFNDVYFRLLDSSSNIASWDSGAGIAANTWYEVDITGTTVASGWSSVAGGFDWTQVAILQVRVEGANGAVTRSLHIDDLYIGRFPQKTTSSSSGYDSTSAGLYEKRTTPPINFPWFNNVADCNSMASVLLNYYKDPSYQIGQKYSQFIPFNLNDNINFTRYGKDLTLPIHKLSWDFKSAEEVITTVELGLPRLDIVDRLKKISTDVLEPGKDYGMQYYVY
jgi:hypothetical protein